MKRWTVKRYVVETYEVWADSRRAAIEDFGDSAYGAAEIKVLKVTAKQVKTESRERDELDRSIEHFGGTVQRRS